jgi:hypothetical protein
MILFAELGGKYQVYNCGQVEYRLDIRRATRGTHVEIYQGTSKIETFLHIQ